MEQTDLDSGIPSTDGAFARSSSAGAVVLDPAVPGIAHGEHGLATLAHFAADAKSAPQPARRFFLPSCLRLFQPAR
jgi:hypothetical protein